MDVATEQACGERLAQDLERLLKGIAFLSVNDKDRECIARCGPENEYEGPIYKSCTFAFLTSFCRALKGDPQGRSHVVDFPNEDLSEDSILLSLPKWQAALGLNISWSIVTFRTIDRASFSKFYNETNHSHRTHGSCQVGSSFFSDQPRLVARRNESVVRIFRTAPRPELRRGISNVLLTDVANSVFDIWIRHYYSGTKNGNYHFKHSLGESASLLEMLTEVDLRPTKPRRRLFAERDSNLAHSNVKSPAVVIKPKVCSKQRHGKRKQKTLSTIAEEEDDNDTATDAAGMYTSCGHPELVIVPHSPVSTLVRINSYEQLLSELAQIVCDSPTQLIGTKGCQSPPNGQISES